jgi:hypothetical protein
VIVPAAEACALYEQKCRFIDEKALNVAERDLFERLTLTFGKGVLNARVEFHARAAPLPAQSMRRRRKNRQLANPRPWVAP